MSQLIPFTGFMGWLTSTSLAAGILAVAILLVKAVFKARLGARWHSAIWLLLYLRLILPWIPESTFSILNLLQPGTILQLDQAELFTATNKSLPLVRDISAASVLPASGTPNTSREQGSNIDWAMLIWLTGAVCLAAYFTIPNILFARTIRRRSRCSDPRIINSLEKCKRLLSVNFALPVIETQLVKSPVLFGLIKPSLLLPPGLYDTLKQEQLEHIFLHELAHVKRKDILTNWLMNLLLVVHWYNPILWYAFHRARLDQEIACDAVAIASLPDKCRTYYGLTILRLLHETVNTSLLPGTSRILGGKDIKRRIQMIQKFKSTSKKWTAVGLVLALVLGATACTKAAGTGDSVKQAQAVVQRYKSQMYTITDYRSFSNSPEDNLRIAQKYKTLFTTEGYNKFISNRVLLFPLQAAAKGKYNLELTNISFKTVSADKNKVVLDYVITLKTSYPASDSRSQITGSESGQISLVNESGQWKINNDWFSMSDLFKVTVK